MSSMKKKLDYDDDIDLDSCYISNSEESHGMPSDSDSEYEMVSSNKFKEINYDFYLKNKEIHRLKRRINGLIREIKRLKKIKPN